MLYNDADLQSGSLSLLIYLIPTRHIYCLWCTHIHLCGNCHAVAAVDANRLIVLLVKYTDTYTCKETVHDANKLELFFVKHTHTHTHTHEYTHHW